MSLEEKHEEHLDHNKERHEAMMKNWRSWGSWFSWGSPVGMGIWLICCGIFIWFMGLVFHF
jgi:hypothetical protein